MGEKSRRNYVIPMCTKFDCAKRGAACNACVRFSEYEPPVRPAICPECRGRCGTYRPDQGLLGKFHPCETCASRGVQTVEAHTSTERR